MEWRMGESSRTQSWDAIWPWGLARPALAQQLLDIFLFEGGMFRLVEGEGSQQLLTDSRIIIGVKPFVESVQSACRSGGVCYYGTILTGFTTS